MLLLINDESIKIGARFFKDELVILGGSGVGFRIWRNKRIISSRIWGGNKKDGGFLGFGGIKRRPMGFGGIEKKGEFWGKMKKWVWEGNKKYRLK